MIYRLEKLNDKMSHTRTNINDRYLSMAMASSIVLASMIPSSGITLFTFSSSGISRWLCTSVGKKFNLKQDKGGVRV